MDRQMMTAPYGTWTSPISARDVAGAGVSPGFAIADGDSAWWQEGRPAEGGRTTIVRDGQEVLPAGWNARTRVHEYGGRSYLPLSGGDFVFANLADQRLYLVRSGVAPEALTPDHGDRYADLTLGPDGELWCVRERHHDGAVSRAIVAVSPDGEIRELVTGADFFAFPTPSPDGRQIAWIDWDHPRMPWDGASLRVAPLASAPVRVTDVPALLGGPEESALAPTWRDNAQLYGISDISGWWNLYLLDAAGQQAPRPLCPRDEEFAGPLWQLGGRPYAVLDDGRLAVLHGRGEERLAILDPASGELTDLDLPYQDYLATVSASGGTVVSVAGAPAAPWSVISVGVADGSSRVLRAASPPVVDEAWLPYPVPLSIEQNGGAVHALVYPPTSPEAQAPEGELPPFVVRVHGGPTSYSAPVLELSRAYFTSRGIGVVELNYGGSAGYGRAYRERLRGQWGVVDVADAYAVAAALVDSGQADGKRLAIRGGSAGGWTVLAAVTTGLRLADGTRFAAAVSLYGVSDLRAMATDTHDFESRYLDGLVGQLPTALEVYLERSPLGHVSSETCPVLLLQGLEDPVVPPAQSELLAAELAAAGVPHVYVSFPGESHGFRRAETVIAALEAELSFYASVMGFDAPDIPPLQLS
jgi:dipeptidyl aminopeptidase/acylaminoacyl peptidase